MFYIFFINYAIKELKNAEGGLMLTQGLKKPTYLFDTNNKPKDLTTYEARSEVYKAILASRVRQYIEREEIINYNTNVIYGFIWGQYTPGLQSVLNGNEDYPNKSKTFDLI